jgi:hypothetical protein
MLQGVDWDADGRLGVKVGEQLYERIISEALDVTHASVVFFKTYNNSFVPNPFLETVRMCTG